MVFSFKNRRNAKHWTEEEKREVVKLNEQHVSIFEIAKKFEGRTSKSITLLLNKLGWKINNYKEEK